MLVLGRGRKRFERQDHQDVVFSSSGVGRRDRSSRGFEAEISVSCPDKKKKSAYVGLEVQQNFSFGLQSGWKCSYVAVVAFWELVGCSYVAVWTLFGCLGAVWVQLRCCLAAWELFGCSCIAVWTLLGAVWELFGCCWGAVWMLFGRCPGNCLAAGRELYWELFGCCWGAVWTLFGSGSGADWELFGCCFEVV